MRLGEATGPNPAFIQTVMVKCAPGLKQLPRLWGFVRLFIVALGLLSISPLPCRAQTTLSSAIQLAMENSPKVKMAQNDVQKAAAALSVTRDIYIPSVVTSGGAGASYGITLSVPTIFTVNAQSLVFSVQQRSYIRAARFDFQSATYALADARDRVAEDAAINYVSIDHGQRALAALSEECELALKLESVVEDRVAAKIDSELELAKARRGALQLKLEKLKAEDDLASLRDHMSELTGIPAEQFQTISESVPSMPSLAPAITPVDEPFPDPFPMLSAEANAKAREQRAIGDSRYTWRPQISFAAQYGRISPLNNVSSFYNLHGNYNTAFAGVQFQFPLLDRVRNAASRGTAADAARAVQETESLRNDLSTEHRKLQRSVAELTTVAELAELDESIAQAELNDMMIEAQASRGGPPITPKEELTARLQERQKFIDLLDAKDQVIKTGISLMRQTGRLDDWLRTLARQSNEPAANQQPMRPSLTEGLADPH